MLTAMPIMLFDFVVPTSYDLVLLLLIGGFATIAQMTMTIAYKYAEASKLAIYGYANIIFSTILGVLIWRELPDFVSLMGGLLIISAGFINYIVINKEEV